MIHPNDRLENPVTGGPAAKAYRCRLSLPRARALVHALRDRALSAGEARSMDSEGLKFEVQSRATESTTTGAMATSEPRSRIE